MADKTTSVEHFNHRTKPLPPISAVDANLFWSRVVESESGCWLWASAAASNYGLWKLSGRLLKAPRVAWFLRTGQDPFGFHVLHHCDNPPCVNPDHLFLGTNRDNALDRHRKGRTFIPFEEEWIRERERAHCRRGHLLSGDNLKPNKDSFRVCRACELLRDRARRDKRKNKVGPKEVTDMRALAGTGVSRSQIAARYNLRETTISTILSGQPWTRRKLHAEQAKKES